MFHFILCIVLSTIIFEPCFVTSTENGTAVNTPDLTKILGGTEISIRQLPFIVSIQSHYESNGDPVAEHICGGSLVRPDWVLTAGHCLLYKDQDLSATEGRRVDRVRNPKRLSVLAGSTDISMISVNHKNRIAVLSTHINRYYDPISLTQDIALMRLVSEFRIYQMIQLTPLSSRTFYDTLKPTNCTAIGWGLTARVDQPKWRRNAGNPEKNVAESNVDNDYRSASPTNNLRFVVLKIIPYEECQLMEGTFWDWFYISKDYQICVESLKTRGALLGDSGSPLLCGGFQVGLTSFGDTRKEADPFLPSVYTRTDFYLDWINATISTANPLQTSRGWWWMNYAMLLALAVALKQI